MTTFVFLAVMIAALMHASWSAIVKGGKDPLAMTLAVSGGGAVVGAVILPFLVPPDIKSWPFLGMTLFIHAAYTWTTASAYRHGDLTLAYPIARGSAPALTALATLVLLSEAPKPLAIAGIAAVSCGAFVTAGAALRLTIGARKTIGFALAAAACTAAYTLVDGQGARLSGQVIGYSAWLMVCSGVFNVVFFRLWQGEAIIVEAAKNWKLGVLGGTISSLSYAIALWAMTQAPIAAVAALRETAIAFAAIIGVVILKEPLKANRFLGAAIILGGAILIRLA